MLAFVLPISTMSAASIFDAGQESLEAGIRITSFFPFQTTLRTFPSSFVLLYLFYHYFPL